MSGKLDIGCKVVVRGNPERTGIVLQFLEGNRVQLGEVSDDPKSIAFPGVYDVSRVEPVMRWSPLLGDFTFAREMNEYAVTEALAKQGVR